MDSDEASIPELIIDQWQEPAILSSYLQVSPKLTDDTKFAAEKSALVARVRRFGFRKVRLFPGSGVSPKDKESIAIVANRVSQIASELPDVEILLETHDGSIA